MQQLQRKIHRNKQNCVQTHKKEPVTMLHMLISIEIASSGKQQFLYMYIFLEMQIAILNTFLKKASDIT